MTMRTGKRSPATNMSLQELLAMLAERDGGEEVGNLRQVEQVPGLHSLSESLCA